MIPPARQSAPAVPVVPAGDEALARQIATLAHARVPPTAGGALAAVAWWNGLERLGLTPPLFVVHDIGLLLSRAAERRRLVEGRRAGGGTRYEELLGAIAASESVAALGATFLRDEVVAVLLGRLLGDACGRWAAQAGAMGQNRGLLPLASPVYGEDPAALARLFDAGWALSFLPHLHENELALRVRLDQLDLGPLRLLGLFPPSAMPPDIVDLQALLSRAGSGDVVDFCLQLLPSLLETKRQGASQRFAVDGYASVERRGPLDALVPSELAHDPDVFDLKALSDELLFYGHERPREGTRRAHGILVDASASMRGAREVFARGLALALAKKLSLMSTDVWLRFFDSRLHRRIGAGTLGGQDLPYVLCFRSERGRNYGRVFQDLLGELEREGGGGRELSVTFITHAECQIPRATVEAIARRAALTGVFVLPSQPLALDYLPLLARHQVVTAESLAQPAETRRRALEIVGQVATPRSR